MAHLSKREISEIILAWACDARKYDCSANPEVQAAVNAFVAPIQPTDTADALVARLTGLAFLTGQQEHPLVVCAKAKCVRKSIGSDGAKHVFTEPETKIVIDQLSALVEQNNPFAQASLATIHANGLGDLSKTEGDKEAVRLYELAAKQGLADAQVHLADIHERGQGGLSKTEGDKEAIRLYGLAAAQGHKGVEIALASMQSEGRGDLSMAEGEYRLAALLEDGLDNFLSTPTTVVRCYVIAANKGHPLAVQQLQRFAKKNGEASYALGLVYEEGWGRLAKDELKAFEYFALALLQKYQVPGTVYGTNPVVVPANPSCGIKTAKTQDDLDRIRAELEGVTWRLFQAVPGRTDSEIRAHVRLAAGAYIPKPGQVLPDLSVTDLDQMPTELRRCVVKACLSDHCKLLPEIKGPLGSKFDQLDARESSFKKALAPKPGYFDFLTKRNGQGEQAVPLISSNREPAR